MISRIFTVISLIFMVLGVLFFTLVALHPMDSVQETTRDFLDGRDVQLPFSVDARMHMEDVRILLVWMRMLTIAALATSLYALSKKIDRKALRISGWIMTILPIAIAIIPWNIAFTVMHVIFFPQGNWMFPASSLLIQTYSESFFILFAAIWGVLTILTGLGLVLAAKKVPA